MRKIIHIDMDCFYAAVETRDEPTLQNKPVAVGGAVDRRGVLSTCNYEARKFGLHAAMPTVRALRLCPELILLPVNMRKYQEISHEIHKILYCYTDKIEPVSLDEAYLDVSHSTDCRGSATLLAQKIRTDIFTQVKLTASAGVAPNKFLAKVASDWNKPNGQFAIPPEKVENFVKSLSVKKIPGIGRVNMKKLANRNIRDCSELQRLSKIELYRLFGKFGEQLYAYCRGIDHRPVETARTRKSVSVETTFIEDLETLTECEQQLPDLQMALSRRLEKYQSRSIHKQFIKIKFSNFTQITKECVVTEFESSIFFRLLCDVLKDNRKKVRLLGIGVRFSVSESAQFFQLSL